jgi:hypothetical protein
MSSIGHQNLSQHSSMMFPDFIISNCSYHMRSRLAPINKNYNGVSITADSNHNPNPCLPPIKSSHGVGTSVPPQISNLSSPWGLHQHSLLKIKPWCKAEQTEHNIGFELKKVPNRHPDATPTIFCLLWPPLGGHEYLFPITADDLFIQDTNH